MVGISDSSIIGTPRIMILYFLILAWSADISPLLLVPPRQETVPIAILFYKDVLIPWSELEKNGFVPSKTANGNIVHLGSWVSGVLPTEKISTLHTIPQIQRVEPATPVFAQDPPLFQTAAQIRAPYFWNSRPRHTGTGIRLGVQEFVGQGWDIFHPDFFRPDGGCFDFVDANANGIFDIGEKLDSFADTTTILSLDNARYEPSLDWIYLDINANGVRDFGASFGAEPAYSEPIFIGDDLNQNENIDVGERFCRLNTSKFAVIHNDGVVYRRGENLHLYDPTQIDPGHGTGAAGIAMGGWPILRKQTGIAPGVDFVAVTDSDHLRALQIFEEEATDVVFFEWNAWHEAQDGSSVLEEQISALWNKGIIPVAPTGNLGGSDHIAQFSVQEEESKELSYNIDAEYIYSAFVISLTWKGSLSDLDITVVAEDTRWDVIGEYDSQELADISFQQWSTTTSRNTAHVILYGEAIHNNIAPNTYQILVHGHADLDVRATITDYSSGWGRGIHWLDYLSEEGSALSPSTADSVISVGAYGGVLSSYYGNVDDIRMYSGRGPRIDGERVVDIMAPDDPIAPSKWYGEETGSYNRFGGTSGATPHVGGAIALYLQAQNPETILSEEDCEEWFSLYSEAMQTEVLDPTGYGRLRMLAESDPSNVLNGDVREEFIDDGLRLSVLEEGWVVAWDIGYDGFIDVEANSVIIDPEEKAIVLWVGDGIHNPQRIRYVVQHQSCKGCSHSRKPPFLWVCLGALLWLGVRRGR